MNEDRKLIIVADKKNTPYANYLIQLIGTRFSAAIFTEKEYGDSQSKIKSSTCVLFLGNGDLAKSQSKTMNIIFDKFSMNYCCLGKRAVLQVNKTVFDSIDYEGFAFFADKYGLSLSKPQVSLDSKSFWLNPKYALPWEAKKKIYPETVYDQLFQCLIMVFYKDYLDEFIA